MMPLILKLCCKLLDIIKYLKFESLLVGYFLEDSYNQVLHMASKSLTKNSILLPLDKFSPFLFDSNKRYSLPSCLVFVVFFLERTAKSHLLLLFPVDCEVEGTGPFIIV